MTDGMDIPDGLLLARDEDGLELRQAGDRPGQGVRADLSGARRGAHPLARALRGAPGRVIDATAGLGADAGVLAALGRSVLAIERNPILSQLLEDAHQRLAETDPEQAARLTLVHGDACTRLGELDATWSHPAAVVLDPMYPVRRSSSALPPKPMQLLRALLEGEASNDEIDVLIDAALRTDARRIVLKRPPEAPTPDSAGTPTFSIESKLVRWDVWDRG